MLRNNLLGVGSGVIAVCVYSMQYIKNESYFSDKKWKLFV